MVGAQILRDAARAEGPASREGVRFWRSDELGVGSWLVV